MSASRAIRFALTTAAVTLVLLLLGVLLFGDIPSVDAQAQTQLVPLVTDQTPLALSNLFGVPQSAVINQAGDYAFIGNGASAVFYRRAGTAAPVRVMQMGDEVPGFPGSRNDITNPSLKLNNSGLIAFRPDFFQANGLGQGVIFTFDGTSLHQIVSGADLAPGGGGAKFERNINLLGLNDSGDVAFTAPLVPSGSVLSLQTTLYIVPAGGAPVRVVGLGDAAPGTGGTFGTLIPMSFNNRGEELFIGFIVGGSGGQGLFVGSTAGVRKVVAQGDANPFGTFNFLFDVALLNNSGDVAFQTGGALWINTLANVTTRKVNTGDAVPAPVGGAFGTPLLQAFDDAGDIAFRAAVSGSAVSNQGLFRFRPSNPLEVVAYRNQAAAGAPGETFNNFSAISMNSTRAISFQGALVGGPVLNGVFQQTGGNPPANIALDGQATTVTGGGTYSLTSTNITQTLNNGSVYFRSDVAGGTADYAEVLISGGVATILTNTADTLPAGARVVLRTFRVGAAGDFVGFLAQHTGGRFSIAVHNITNQATTVLTTDGDAAPGTGGGRLRITNRNTVFVAAGGKVVFSPSISGGSTFRALFLAGPGSGLTKVVADGDVAPGTGGKTFSNSGLTSVTPSPINDAGQVLVNTTLSPGGISAAFVWSPGTGLSKVAAVGDVISGRTLTGFTFDRAINSAGQVAFLGTTASGQGLYVGSPGGTAAKVVAAGDPGPSGSTFSTFQTPGFNDSGEVAFMASLMGGPGGGVFVGSTSGPPVTLVLNGGAAPAGGNFSILEARPDVVINNQHDVAFRANLTGGTADSGYFVRRGSLGALQAPVLQGQPAAGTTGVFDTIAGGINNLVGENFQLSPAGDLAFQSYFLAGGQRSFATWHVKTDNTVEDILVRGIVAPEFGGGSAVISTISNSWNSGGRYPLWARVSGGTFTDGIFLFVPTISTNTPAGMVVPVTVADSTTGTTPVALTFDSITQAGASSLTTSSGGPAIPTAFALGNPPVFYNLETTATFTGSIGVCIDFSSVDFPAGSNLRLLHFENGAWVDVTVSGPTGNIVCGNVTSLSPFTVVKSQNSTPAGTTTALVSSVNPSDVGQSLTFTATVTSAAGTPTGTVQFKIDGANSGPPVILNSSGVAQLTTSTLTAGTHTVTAAYNGDANFTASSGTLVGGQVVRSQPTFSITDVLATEGDSGTKNFNFTVILSAASNLTVKTDYATANGTATAPSDYTALPTTTLTFNPGDLTKTITVVVNGDQTFEANETLLVNLSSPVNASISKAQGTGTILNDDAQGGIISFSQANYNIGESAGLLTITVNRTGDTSGPAAVDYGTSDGGASLGPCSSTSGLASARCDFTTAMGRLNFGAGETQRTFIVLMNRDSYAEGPEFFTVNLSNQTGGSVLSAPSTSTVTIGDDSAGLPPNGIDDAQFFVLQHYHDFLNRQPDTSGLNFWTNEITSCGSGQQCREVKQVNVSAAFFLSIEFQQTGYLVERIYKAAYGDTDQTSSFGGNHQFKAPIIRVNEFLPDTQEIGLGVIVGQSGWETVLENNKRAFSTEFVQRARFTTAFPPSMTPQEFVDTLNTNAGNPLSPTERNQLVADLAANNKTRAEVLKAVAEDPDLFTAESNRAFVLMQFFGYLRRNPNDAPDSDYTGYDFWLTKLNQFNGSFVNADMVKAFITSSEYRQRFGP
jgi:hypothetical protein